MEITKRNGMAEPYNKEKVAIAIRKASPAPDKVLRMKQYSRW